MEKKTEAEIIEELLKADKVKTLKPNECALLYDEKQDRIIGICNKDGNLQVTMDKKLRPPRKRGKEL